MKSIEPKKRVIILFVILAVLTGAYFIIKAQSSKNGFLQVSGTIEAQQVDIAAELSGRVVEIFVKKGQVVKAGDPLFRLDDELLKAQRKRGDAALESAQANLITAQTNLTTSETAVKSAEVALEAARAAAEAERLPVEKSLDDLFINAPAARGEAARNVAAANRAVRDAEYLLFNYNVSSLQNDLTPSEGLSLTLKLLNEARAAFEPYRYESENDDTREKYKEDLDEAQSEYDSAVRRIELEAALEAAQSRLRKAEDDLSKLQDGPNPQDVAILEARLAAIDAAPRQAETGLDAAKVGVETARSRLEAAKASVSQALADQEVIDVQMKRLKVASPIDGVVLNLTAESGEVMQVGAPVMTIGRLTPLKITVYLPEDRYGEVKLDQEATMMVDSFPGKVFQARVIGIADQAEFTPRNVQTAEGRRNTVFGIELTVDDPDQLLKPGMPADVLFE